MKVSICIPYIRKKKFKRCVKLIRANAGYQNYEILSFYDRHRIGCPLGLKKLVDRSTGDAVCFIGDDCLPEPGFLKHAVEDMKKITDGWGLVGLNDMTGRTLPTHWLAHKKLLPYLGGEFFHTGYTHCCCDVELLERVQELGRFIYSEHSIVLHDHPMIQYQNRPKAETDKDYARVYSKEVWGRDRALFALRKFNGWET